MTYAKDIATRNKDATQTEQGRQDQVQNHAGGFVFQLDNWGVLNRFLILGTVGGTCYVSQRQATQEALDPIFACLEEDPKRVLELVVTVSDEGKAVKNDPAIMVLALLLNHSSVDVRREAIKAVPKVCRIGTHVFSLAEYIKSQRGWGNTAKKAIREWFFAQSTQNLAYQAMKYKSRNGWSMRDLLRVSHWAPEQTQRKQIVNYMLGKDYEATPAIKAETRIVEAVKIEQAVGAEVDEEAVADLIVQHRLPREVIPTELLNSVTIWKALLQDMPLTALIRNLGKVSAIGLLKPMSKESEEVANRLQNEQALKRARIHPMSILVAFNQYKMGRGMRGSLSWSPSPEILKALEKAYFLSFQFVEPVGKRFYLGIDISMSMDRSLADLPISCAQAAGCMASVTSSTEPYTYVAGFSDGSGSHGGVISSRGAFSRPTMMKPIYLPDNTLDVETFDRAFGATDCALPMLDAIENKMEVDTFVVYTDNETWFGNVHPYRALQQYREKSGISAKLIVVGMTATPFTIADPADAGMLDVVGCSTDTPKLIATFAGD